MKNWEGKGEKNVKRRKSTKTLLRMVKLILLQDGEEKKREIKRHLDEREEKKSKIEKKLLMASIADKEKTNSKGRTNETLNIGQRQDGKC